MIIRAGGGMETMILMMTMMVLIIRAGGGMESVCQAEDVGLTSPLPPIGGQVSTIAL